MRTRTLISVVMASASLIALTGADAQTRTPIQADFDACNRIAETRAGGATGSASPRMPGTTTSSGSTARPKSDSSSGSSMQSPSTSSGATSTAPGSSGGSGIPGASASDDSVRGIDPAQRGNMAYEQVYRDCMKGRGF